MQRIVTQKIDRHHYRADACIFWCFDDRFSPLLEAFVKMMGFTRIDPIEIAGGAKGIASPASEWERGYLLDQIGKSIALHEVPLIVLMVHTDCGAYGKKFEDAKAEQAFYKSELEKAEAAVSQFLRARNLSATIEKYFADFEGLIKL